MRIVATLGEPIEIETSNGTIVLTISGKANVTASATIPARRGRKPGRPEAFMATAPASPAAESLGSRAGNPKRGKRGKRTFSPEARARLAEAARKRWAKAKRAGKSTL
jgi:hypothetical protein